MKGSTVAVVIVCWNGKPFLDGLLGSLRDQSYRNFSIHLVDNGSTDGSLEFVRREFPEVVTYPLPRNLGFSRGNNVALESILSLAEAKFIATLNQDMRVDPSWLDALIAAAKDDSQVGMVASKIRFMDRPRVLNSTGFNILRDGSAIDRGRGEPDIGQYDSQPDVFGASAGAALYRRKLFETVGLFDEAYFAYYEDVDLAWRARTSGWSCRFAPEALAYHKYSASTSPRSAFKVFHGERNRIWNVLKNFPFPHFVLAFPYGWLKNFATLFAYAHGSGRGTGYVRELTLGKILSTMLRANVEAWSGAGPAWEKRQTFRSRYPISWREAEQLFRRYTFRFADVPFL